MDRICWRHRFSAHVAAAALSAGLAAEAIPGGTGAAAAPTACSPADAGQTATVAAVIDGDILQLEDGRVVQLAGVEVPMRPLGLPDEAPWLPSAAAGDLLGALVAGRSVALTLAAEAADRHGRWRANVFVGASNRWVQAAVVEAGLARVHWLPGDPACLVALLAAEDRARRAERGVWASPQYAVREAGDASLQDRDGLYELVEGRVTSVGHGSSMIFLDFGRDYRRDFTIMISPPMVERLSEAGLPVDGFAGRHVRVRGMIEDSGGPAIRLSDPSEIEVLDDGHD